MDPIESVIISYHIRIITFTFVFSFLLAQTRRTFVKTGGYRIKMTFMII